jgi:hypothetical protein
MKTRRLLDFETCSVALFASIVRHDPSLRKARAAVPRPCAASTGQPLNHTKRSISSVRFDRSLIK